MYAVQKAEHMLASAINQHCSDRSALELPVLAIYVKVTNHTVRTVGGKILRLLVEAQGLYGLQVLVGESRKKKALLPCCWR